MGNRFTVTPVSNVHDDLYCRLAPSRTAACEVARGELDDCLSREMTHQWLHAEVISGLRSGATPEAAAPRVARLMSSHRKTMHWRCQSFMEENMRISTACAMSRSVPAAIIGAWEAAMHRQRDFLLLVTLAVAVATPAMAQIAAPAGGPARTQNAASVPDFSGVWAKPYFGIEPPLSGPGPVLNKSRRRQLFDLDGRPLPNANAPLVTDNRLLVGDYTNPILKPPAAEVVKKRGELELSGTLAPTLTNRCWPESVPYVFAGDGMQMLQRPDKITILYHHDHQVRHVRLNQSHPAQVTPSWYGDSVGHYEGDTLVIDTVGIKIGPFAMVDWYGTPHTQALHVVERYRLLDYEAAKAAQEWVLKHHLFRFPKGGVYGLDIDLDDKGKGLQLELTVEDEGVFKMPWSATVTYRRALASDWTEMVCAEGREHHLDKDAAPPHADKPDF